MNNSNRNEVGAVPEKTDGLSLLERINDSIAVTEADTTLSSEERSRRLQEMINAKMLLAAFH